MTKPQLFFSKAGCNLHNCKFSSKVLTIKVSETFQDENIYSSEKEILSFLKGSAKDETFLKILETQFKFIAETTQ